MSIKIYSDNSRALFVKRIRIMESVILLVLICFLFQSCAKRNIWFKGNTHAHTILCGHADTHPDSVALWYLERGYHFLILSEHNQFINPDSVNLPLNRRSDFILIPGEEVTGHKYIHTTGMNTQRRVGDHPQRQTQDTLTGEEKFKQVISRLSKPITESKTEVLQRHSSDILDAGGIPILNHPNFVTGAQPHDILPVKGLHLLELYNGHPHVNNWGTKDHVSVEEKWDSLLTAGMLVLGVSSDDAHHFKTWSREASNPGRGWIMVNSKKRLTAKEITKSVSKGKFYASNGVILKKLKHTSRKYKVQIDTIQTFKELGSPYVTGRIDSIGKEGFEISFIGSDGKILQSESKLKSILKFQKKRDMSVQE